MRTLLRTLTTDIIWIWRWQANNIWIIRINSSLFVLVLKHSSTRIRYKYFGLLLAPSKSNSVRQVVYPIEQSGGFLTILRLDVSKASKCVKLGLYRKMYGHLINMVIFTNKAWSEKLKFENEVYIHINYKIICLQIRSQIYEQLLCSLHDIQYRWCF